MVASDVSSITLSLMVLFVGVAAVVTWSLRSHRHHRIHRHMASLADTVAALENVATSLNATAQSLNTSLAGISAPVDTSVLDGPLADVSTAAQAVATASASIAAAVAPPAAPASTDSGQTA